MLSPKNDFLRKTCFRWISENPIENNSEINTLQEALDKLIDSHLWHLPIPRFCRSFQSQNLFDDKSFDHIKNLYNDLKWKHTPYIQIVNMSLLEKQACILMITSLQYDISCKLTLDDISEDSFIDNSYDLIVDEIGSKATNMLELVKDVIIYKDFEDFKKCNSAEKHWLKVSDLESLNLINNDIQKKIDEYLFQFEKYSNLKTFLRIENIEDEDPKFGFYFSD